MKFQLFRKSQPIPPEQPQQQGSMDLQKQPSGNNLSIQKQSQIGNSTSDLPQQQPQLPQQQPQQQQTLQQPPQQPQTTLFQILDCKLHLLNKINVVSKESLALDFQSDIVVGPKIAEGGAAVIHMAKLLNPTVRQKYEMAEDTIIVVKILKEPPNINRIRIQAAFEQEVAIMWVMSRHMYSARLLGYCRNPMVFISKFYEAGSLAHLIYRTNQALIIDDLQYTGKMLVNIASDIIHGIKEMHAVGIIHNDVKPQNVLLEQVNVRIAAVLCDFGIATVVGNPVVGVKSLGTSTARGASAAYAAPEVFAKLHGEKKTEDQEMMKTVDIFAFGIMLFEMIARRAPWLPLKGSQEIEQAIIGGKRPEATGELADKIKRDEILGFLSSTMEMCWLADPTFRPSAETLTKTFDYFMQGVQ